jgi:hypothetical protein|tara:strand:- start:203 stop:370 length:168 start_codon:yes stop_codon:yes gene_type:complete
MLSRSALRLANPRLCEAYEFAKLSFFWPVSAAIIDDGSGLLLDDDFFGNYLYGSI